MQSFSQTKAAEQWTEAKMKWIDTKETPTER